MKRITQRSKRILITIMAIPLLSVFVLTLTCSLGDFVLSCCAEPTRIQADHHDHLSLHQAHEADPQESHAHFTTPDESSEGHHSGDEDDCCNDLTTSFFSVFQVQPNIFIADQPASVKHLPGVAIINTFNNYYEVDQSLIYHGFEPPPKIASTATGWGLRILHQSFLN